VFFVPETRGKIDKKPLSVTAATLSMRKGFGFLTIVI
jgi:hypothetical protein